MISHCVRFIKMYRCTARSLPSMNEKEEARLRWIIRIRKRALKALIRKIRKAPLFLEITHLCYHPTWILLKEIQRYNLFIASRLFRGSKVDLLAPLSLLELFPVV